MTRKNLQNGLKKEGEKAPSKRSMATIEKETHEEM